MGIKKFVKSSLRKVGYQLNSIETIKCKDDKPKELIKELYGIYRELLFKEMPLYDEAKIDLMANLLGTGISESIYIINYLNRSLKLDGDICEFGVAQGATSALMANEIRNTEKSIWLFDSFEGLPKPTEKDVLKDDIFNLGSMEHYAGTMSYKVDVLKEKLRDINYPLSKIIIIQGFIEETINQPNLPDKVCFAYIDFDFYNPILIALNYLDKVLEINGVIIVDDYDFFSTGAKSSVDEFINLHKEKYTLLFPIKAAGYFCIIEKLS